MRYGHRATVEEIQAQAEKRFDMAKKAQRKKALPRFVDANRDDVITEVRESLAALYDAAIEAQKRQASMGTPTPDPVRFPAAQGGTR
jgi:hypothetical protein